MSFQVPSSPSTPDKSRSFLSNVSTTPAGAPSATNSFTPHGFPGSTVYGSSQIGGGSQFSESSQSLFTKSGRINPNDSIFGSSIASNDFAAPPRAKSKGLSEKPFAASQSMFSMTNGSRFGESSNFGESTGFGSSQMSEDIEEDMEEEMEPEEETEEEDADGDEDIQQPSKPSVPRFSFLDSHIGNPLPPPSAAAAQRKAIYSNPTNAKRPKLDERWANQSPLRKTKLSPKKVSAMPSIVRNFASRSRTAPVDEPSNVILGTEDEICRMYDEARNSERDTDFEVTLSEVVNRLAATWKESTQPKGISRGAGIGPGENAPNVAKASFIASLLLQLHHPPPANTKSGSFSNPFGRALPRSLVLAGPRADKPTPIPKVLLDWLEANGAPQSTGLLELKEVEPNPTASSNFWEIVNAAVLHGRLEDAAGILRSADFNYARSALEDGLPQPGYRGTQLQNVQRCVNKALQILDSCPGLQHDDWDIKGTEWSLYRKRVLSVVADLEEFAEGDEEQLPPQPPLMDARFQAVNFGLTSNGGPEPFSFAQSARMAESRVPWTIYQNLRSLYRILLGDAAAIMNHSQDWIEATIGLTVWWDGEDDAEISTQDLGATFNFQRSRMPKSQAPRAVDSNPEEAYLHRLDLALSSATSDKSDEAGFRVNSLSSLEVGLASVFEGNVEGVMELLQTWSLSIASAVAEVASAGGWLESSAGTKPLSGLSDNDLMVLSYGQDGNAPTGRVRKDDVLSAYAAGLFERPSIENEIGTRSGWELALEISSRLDDSDKMQKSVSELLDKLPLDTAEQMDKVVLLCSELGLDKEGRRVSERYGDITVSKSEEYGLALVCYARAHSRRKVKSVVDLLISYSLVQSRAYPASPDLDEQLRTLIREPKTCLSAIASVDEEAASIIQFYFSGYATLRRFYETRDEAVGLQEGQRPRFKPLARRRAAAQALVAVIGSAADSIYGGLYDPDRDSAVQVDGLLALLGEALALINQSTPILSVSQQFTILSAIEDLESVTPRVYAQCEECFRSTLIEYQSSESAVAPPSPRTLLKKSVSSLTASSTFSFIGNDMIESARTRSMSGSGSAGSSAVLVPRPGGGKALVYERGWDWRSGLPEEVKGEDILRMLRSGLARGLCFGALGSI
ncbi:hypothetical protein ASPWEDRAFT_136383 [Aspergillus wentii DTO 134E9]|uniref:Nuclear pore complex protein Nup85 n=1 Tax=Aspergillus wentii DTO 134E9 TaxID=1073089 RepID=A0A1L9RHH6_ASPWE|nr:uncharacterized protein ASPWEDRAFT_136383 [Aspergillus wentii DTO 134E9]KAI9925718.1 hypothetical protein MW887_005520 [Aspergillus wentii]OJJ34382.1 hypothetical protein ASPWEDRAFT_136383 [Aspergillus wentii DTO 134E9]